MGNRARALALATWFGTLAAAVTASGSAHAQATPADAPAKATETKTTVTTVVTTPSPAAAPAPAPAAPAAAPAGQSASDTPAAAAPSTPPPSDVMGATYTDHPKTNITDSPRPPRRAIAPARGGSRSAVRAKSAVGPDAPIATFPGFETLPDGGTRVFVQLSKTVTVEEHHGASSLTYVLKGAHVLKRNNTNPLVTIHMNTPVASARLVPSGGDLDFVVALRASSTPTWKVAQASDGGSRLEIDFPKGSFVNAAEEAQPIAKGDPGDVIPNDGESAVPRDGSSAAARTAAAKKKPMRLTAPPPKSKP